jgi:RsmE family RNA methyltransferase
VNLILLDPEDLAAGPGRILLRGRRAEHIRSVLRAGRGDTLDVGLLGGRTGRASVLEVSADRVLLAAELTADPPPPCPHVLVLGLPRPKALRRTLIHAVCLGIKRIFVVHCAHVEKSYWQSPLLSPRSLQETFTIGLEQSGDTVLPGLELRKRFKPFVEDELPALLRGRSGFVATPSAHQSCPADPTSPCLVAVGPDRGFTEYEERALVSAGMTPVSLGPRTMRVEASVPAMLARLG